MTTLPAHMEAELARLGVKRPPAKPPAPTTYPTPWMPTYAGEEPPH